MTPNDPSRVREQKTRLYQSAVEAWEKGEAGAALSNLEELAALDRNSSDPDSSSYRNLYNQVKIARRAEDEPDLDRRIAILEEALRVYPGDPHFEGALEKARDLSSVVNSIVADARSLEQNGQFGDALDQWQMLKSIYGKQPGLDAEIERLTKLRDAKPPTAADSPWVEQARKYLEAGDYQRANQALGIGLIEYPGHPELLALQEQVRTGQEHGTRALELLAKAREATDRGAPDTALPPLREAYQLDSRNAVIRGVLANTLLEQAKRVVDSDWMSAESLVREALRLEPTHPQGPVLVNRIKERMAGPPATATPVLAPGQGQPPSPAFTPSQTFSPPPAFPPPPGPPSKTFVPPSIQPPQTFSPPPGFPPSGPPPKFAPPAGVQPPQTFSPPPVFPPPPGLPPKFAPPAGVQPPQTFSPPPGFPPSGPPPKFAPAAGVQPPQTFSPPPGFPPSGPPPKFAPAAGVQPPQTFSPPPGFPPPKTTAPPPGFPPTFAPPQAFPPTFSPPSSGPNPQMQAGKPPTGPGTLRQDPTLAIPPGFTDSLFNPPAKESAPPQPGIPAPPQLPKSAQGPPKKPAPAPSGHPRKLLVGTGIAVGVLLLGALGYTYWRNRKPTPPPADSKKFAVVVHSSVDGAEIKVNGNTCGTSTCKLDLTAGNYQVDAQLTGYQSATQTITVGPGASTDFSITLAPQGPRLSMVTDLAEGTVSLDDNPAGQIQGGGAEVGNLTPGKHVLAIKSGDSTASIPIEIDAGTAPKLSGPLDCKNLRCFLVAGYGSDAHLYGATGFRVTLDGKPQGVMGADGLQLSGLTPGNHELSFDSDAGQHDPIVFESEPSATLYVSMRTAQNLGILTVETNEDQVHLLINGQKYKRDTARGRLVVYLPPQKYTVTVQKDGFAPAAEQTVEVKRGIETKLSFTLTVAKGILAVHHAPPGTDVQVDNISRGTTHPDGEFQVGGIEPGHHVVTLRHDGYKPLQTEQAFAAGKTVDVQGTMEALPTTGTLRFDINPPGVDAHVRVRRDSETQEREVNGASISLAEGRYVVSVSAAQYQPTSTSVQIVAGQTVVAAMTLRRAEAPKTTPKGPTVTFGLEDWLKVPGWTPQNGMIVHKGGDWVMAPTDITQGTVRFTVLSIKGKHVEWIAAQRDEKNYMHYELDEKSIVRYEVKNGSKSSQVKVPHGLDKKKPMGISLTITPQTIVLSVQRGGWVEVDRCDIFAAPAHGRFGFRIPGSDEIGLQDFTIAAGQ